MKALITWTILWYLVWGVYNVYFRWSWEKLKTYKYIPRGLFFLVSFFAVFFIFREISIFYLKVLFISFIFNNIVGLILAFDKGYFKKFNKDRLFILFQSFNILYQQTSIVVALFLLKRISTSGYLDIYFALFFGIIHLPLLFLPWIKLKYHVVLGCFIVGYIFSYLIQNFSYGIILTSLLHYIFYAWQIHYLKDEEKI